MQNLTSRSMRGIEGRLARRAASIEPSAVRSVLEQAERYEALGKRMIHLEIGRPWFDTPAPVKEAAKRALDEGKVHYAPNRGIPELRQAISEKLQRENGIVAEPDTEVFVTCGNKQATYLTIMALVNPGDEVVVANPEYSPHEKEVVFAGGVPKHVELSADNGWRLEDEALRAAISERTKLIFLNTPQNPSGRVFTREELELVADVAQEHDLLVLTDETYEYITFDGHVHHSLASFPGMGERTISTFALTKSFAMDGWRLGYLSAPPEITAAMVKLVQLSTASPNTFAQHGAVVAVQGGRKLIQEMVAYDERARTLFVDRLNAMGLPCPPVEGTIYAFPDTTSIARSSVKASQVLLEECGVAATPGLAYGTAGEGRVRFAFGAAPVEELEEALDRIEQLAR